jgi:predicted phosphodiesterase
MSLKVALLSDVHGNSPALKAVLDDIQCEKCAEVFVLGDIINGLDPQGCVHLLQTWSVINNTKISYIKGNAEAYLTTPEIDSLPLKNKFRNEDMVSLIRWWQDHLSASDFKWISLFPDTLRWNNAYLVHDSPLDRWAVQTLSDPEIKSQYREWFYHGLGIAPNMGEQEQQKLLGYMVDENLSEIFCGHTHVPFYRELDNKIICNIGSAGAPLDGDPRPSWVLLERTPSGKQSISIRRVEYDISLIHQLIDNTPDYPNFQIVTGFRNAYKTWFSTGRHWRSHLPKTVNK